MNGRRLSLLLVGGSLGALTLLLLLASPEAEPVVAVQQAAAAPVSPAPGASFVEHTSLGRGGTLVSALHRLDVPPDWEPLILKTAAAYLDPRKLPAHTGLSVCRDGSRRLLSVALRAEADRFLRIVVRGEVAERSVRVELLDVPVVASIETAGGVVRSSVAQALSGSDLAPQLTRLYSEIFQWDVDLLVDPRPGDVVSIVYRVLRLGPSPPDLPRFGAGRDEPGELLRIEGIVAADYIGRKAKATAFWVGGEQGSGDFYDAQGLPLRKTFLKSPLNYRRITSRFSSSRRHPVTRKVVPHHGVDFAAARGTPVVATADGRVVAAGWSGALGKAVRIRHNDEYTTVYGHLQGFARGIRRGRAVRQNQVIGYVGSTGRATGPHVHYTVQRYGRAIDPLRMKNPPVEPLDPDWRPWLDEAVRRWRPRLGSIRDGLELRLADGTADDDSPTAVRPGA